MPDFSILSSVPNTQHYCKMLNLIQQQIKLMSSSINAVKLFQISMSYDRHRLKINSIKSKSSPLFKKQKQQMSILSNRNAHKQYNSKFKQRQTMNQIIKKNSKMLDKLEDLSRIKRPNSTKIDQLRNSVVSNREKSKRQSYRTLQLQNQRFVKKLFSVKSTISNIKQNNSFYEHKNRSQMLSRFKTNQRGVLIAKSELVVEKRIKLQPIHKKLEIIQSRVRQVRQIKMNRSPIKYNSMKILKINPQK